MSSEAATPQAQPGSVILGTTAATLMTISVVFWALTRWETVSPYDRDMHRLHWHLASTGTWMHTTRDVTLDEGSRWECHVPKGTRVKFHNRFAIANGTTVVIVYALVDLPPAFHCRRDQLQEFPLDALPPQAAR
jgi:hypothetical protein